MEIIEFLLYSGSRYQFCIQNITSVARDFFGGQICQGNPTWSETFNFPKKVVVYTILSPFVVQNDRKKSEDFKRIIRENL